MRYHNWLESRKCFSDDEDDHHSWHRKSPRFSSQTWCLLRDRKPYKKPVSSSSQMSVALLDVASSSSSSPSPSSSSSVVHDHDESTSKVNDLCNVNFNTSEHEGRVRVLHPKKMTDLTIDVRQLKVKMSVVNVLNDIWMRLPKEGYIKKKKMRSLNHWFTPRYRAGNGTAIAISQSVITHPYIANDGCDKDEACFKLDRLKINSESVNNDLVEKMSTLSCSQNPDWDKKVDELTNGWNMIMNGLLVDKLDGRIGNLRIDEVNHGENATTQFPANPPE